MKGVIFDMDGLLIDSEPLWQQAEIEVFNSIGVPMTIDMCRQVMGIRIGEVVRHWYNIYRWTGKSPEKIEEEIVKKMISLIKAKGKALPGVESAIETCSRHDLKIALASSSSMKIINTSLEALGIKDKFTVIRSADNEPYGKPHPGIYLTALEEMAMNYNEVVVLEDSFYGAIAAKAARLKVVVIPEKSQAEDPKWGFTDLKLNSLEEFTEEMLNKLI